MMTFKTDDVIIRRFQMRDAEQEDLNIFLYNNSNIVPDDVKIETGYGYKQKAKLVVKSAINEYYTDEPIWAIENKETKRIIGYIRVCNYSSKNKMCNLTWAMSNRHWDNGFMKDALVQIFNFMFTKRDVELIECSYYQPDDSNNVILDEIGMTKEATLRARRVNEHTKMKENFIIYSISKEEFYQNFGSVVSSKHFRYLKRKI